MGGWVTDFRVLIADDHPMVRGALREAIKVILPAVSVIEAGSFEELAAAFAGGKDIDLVLLDLAMPGVQGFSGLLYLRASHPQSPVVVVSGNEDRTVIRRCIEMGASAYLPKSLDPKSMQTAIKSVLDGATWTPDDVDLSASPDQETSDMVRRLASLTPQQVRVLIAVVLLPVFGRSGSALGLKSNARGNFYRSGRSH